MDYLRSTPGRIMLAACGAFLLGPAMATVLAGSSWSVRAMAIFPMIGVVGIIVSIGLGLADFARETALAILVLPIAWWGVFPGLELMAHYGWRGTGLLVLALAALLLGGAVTLRQPARRTAY